MSNCSFVFPSLAQLFQCRSFWYFLISAIYIFFILLSHFNSGHKGSLGPSDSSHYFSPFHRLFSPNSSLKSQCLSLQTQELALMLTSKVPSQKQGCLNSCGCQRFANKHSYAGITASRPRAWHEVIRRTPPILKLGNRWEWADSPPGKEPSVPTDEDAGWAPEPIWTLRRRLKVSVPCQESHHNSRVIQPVA